MKNSKKNKPQTLRCIVRRESKIGQSRHCFVCQWCPLVDTSTASCFISGTLPSVFNINRLCVSTLCSFDQIHSWPLIMLSFKSSVADGFKPRHVMTTFVSMSMYCTDTHPLKQTFFFLIMEKEILCMCQGLHLKWPELTEHVPGINFLFFIFFKSFTHSVQ